MKFRPFKRARKQLGVLLPEFDRLRRRTRDVAVISYPKSGRTWVRFMLNTANIKLLYDHAGAENRKALTFDQLRSEPANWSRWKIIFVFRDPRDTVVSSYFEATKRLKAQYRFEGTLAEFLRDPRYGIEKIARYNLLWLDSANPFKAFLPVSYEQLHEGGRAELLTIIRFTTGREPRPIVVERAWRAGGFDQMRQVELSVGPRMNENLKLGGGRPDDPDSMKTRRGKVGGWTDYFDEADKAYAEETLSRLDYFTRAKTALGRVAA